MPLGGGGGGSEKKAKDEVPKIYIKNVAKAIANEKKVRFKKTTARKNKKRDLKKQYTSLKAETRKRIKTGKKAHYTRENDKIKKNLLRPPGSCYFAYPTKFLQNLEYQIYLLTALIQLVMIGVPVILKKLN